MKKSITIPPSKIAVVVTAESIDGKITVAADGLTASVGASGLNLSATDDAPIDPPVEPPVPPVGTRKNLILESLFNTTSLTTALKGWSDQQRDKSKAYSLAVVNNALRFEIRPGDESSSSIRCEITKQIQGDVWIGFKMKLENFAQNDKGGGESLGIQWHGNGSQNNPPLTLNLYGTDIELVRCPDDKGLIRIPIAKLADWNNRWVSIVFHTNWKGANGALEMWVDGKQVVNMGSVNMGVNDVNLKCGQNIWSWHRVSGITTKSRVLYLDDIRIGNSLATYNDVAP